MPPKKKEKEPPPAKIVPVDQIELHKYCPRKMFDVLFVNEADDYSRETLSRMIETARNYEDISCLTFITYDEVKNLVDYHENSLLPAGVKLALKDTCEKAKKTVTGECFPTPILAQLMKLKLTEVMYQHYIKEVTKMQKRKKLEEDLNILTKECKKAEPGKGKGGKGGKESKDSGSKKSKASGKSTEEVKVIEDYTTIPIEGESDIIFDDDIYNHVWFYVFQGFYDPELLTELISVNNTPITAVIKISAILNEDITTISNDSMDDIYMEYWKRLCKYFDGPGRLPHLENTILMSYMPSGNDYKESFQQLLYIVKNISDTKLQHLNYVRHIKIYEVQEVYNYFPLECLTVYSKTLGKIPYELVKVPVLLNSLLREVCTRVDDTRATSSMETVSRQSVLSSLNSSTSKCINPCRIEAFFKNRLRTTTPEKNVFNKSIQSFLTHEDDEINIILNSYKKRGQVVCESVMNFLKTIKPLNTLNDYVCNYNDISHKHDVAPSTKTNTKVDEEMVMHIFYLIFFSTFGAKAVPIKFEETDLTINLQTYDHLEFAESCQTRIVEDVESGEQFKNDADQEIEEAAAEEEFGSYNVVQGENVTLAEETESNTETTQDEYADRPSYYDVSAIQYFWKESLAPDVLLQQISMAQEEYLYMEQRFSPGTDNLLLCFSNRLDEFGINTKVYEQSLITPICLRDFCKYISVDKAKWLATNKPPKYFRKGEELEECKGVKRINRLQLFQEYSYLLESTIQTENESVEKQIVDDNSVTFEHLVEELKNYPPSSKIKEECKKSDKESHFLAYDLGTKYFQIKGARTTFYSHDDVKITVDNTRFLDEEAKCTVNITSRGNSLILHSNNFYSNEDYDYHMHLADGTIVTFIVYNLDKREREEYEDDYQSTAESEGTEEKNVEEDKDEEVDSFADLIEEVKVLSVDKNHFESAIQNNAVDEEENSSPDIDFKAKEEIFNALKQATESNCPIYKVTNNVTYLKKLKPEVEIPLSNILRRILHKKIEKKNYSFFTKRYMPPSNRPKCMVRGGYDAKIALPNGLYISFYPSEVKSTHTEVKQEFLTKNPENSLIEEEEFRLFSREGYILIKRIDGTIRILKSNGDIIDFEKLDTNSETVKKWRLKPCHCKNVNDYRKKLNRMLRRNDEDTTLPNVSRRDQFRTKKGYILSSNLVNMLEKSKVPYLRNTVLKFNGNRICFEAEKVTQKRIYHITQEVDYFAQDVYFERSDGFRSMFDKNGKQQVKFPDGTKISSTIHVAKDLVDSYVYVSLTFQYEHPNYVTVLYHFNNTLEVLLNNAVFTREMHTTMCVKIDDDISVLAKKDAVTFEKSCLKCTSKYKCTVTINPFIARKTDYTETFLHARDSYNKHFYVDFAGNCERNVHYIKGPFNAFNCNHYKKMSYKKLLVVNKDFSGHMFWTDNMVDSKRKNLEKDENGLVKEFKDMENGNIQVVKFRREVFDQYSSRFLNTNLLKDQMCLAKYKQDEVKQLFYTTFRVVRKITDFEAIKACLTTIMQFFINVGVGTEILKILTKLLEEDEGNPEDNMSTKEVKEKVEEPLICTCVQEKINIAGKIKNWQEECGKFRSLIRNYVIVNYFTSEFCEVIKNEAEEETVPEISEGG